MGIEFNLILKAVKPDISAGMFWRLLLGTVVMLAAGYCGEAGFVNAYAGFAVGMAGWGFILMEIFTGEAGQAAGGGSMNKYVSESFNTMRLIVTAGWSIYPLGYFFGYLMGAVNDDVLNLVYNLADFVNKIAFLGHLVLCQEQHHGISQARCTPRLNFMKGCLRHCFVFFVSHAFCRRPCSRGQSMHFSFSWTQSVPLPHVFSASTIVPLSQSTLH